MTWKPKKQEPVATGLEKLWEEYGTWISTAVTVVLAVVLVVILVRRWQESQLRKGQAELNAIAVGQPMAREKLGILASQHGDSKLGRQIRIKLAIVEYRAGDYEAAEKTLAALANDARLDNVDRAKVNLTRAYVAQELANAAGQNADFAKEKELLAEARRRFELAEKDVLYASEAKHMLEVLDRAEAAAAGAVK